MTSAVSFDKFVARRKTNSSIARMKRYAASQCEQELNGNHDDVSDLVFLPDLKLALENLGGKFTPEEIKTLLTGIKEDEEEGVAYEDVIGVLIFASFFIAAFDRNGNGSVIAKEVNNMIICTKPQFATKPNNSDGISEDNNSNFSGINMANDVILDYSKFIQVIESTRQVFSIYTLQSVMYKNKQQIEVYLL